MKNPLAYVPFLPLLALLLGGVPVHAQAFQDCRTSTECTIELQVARPAAGTTQCQIAAHERVKVDIATTKTLRWKITVTDGSDLHFTSSNAVAISPEAGSDGTMPFADGGTLSASMLQYVQNVNSPSEGKAYRPRLSLEWTGPQGSQRCTDLGPIISNRG